MNVIVYPRGFLGWDIGLTPPDNSTTLSEIISAVNNGRPLPLKHSGITNNDVQLLWNQFCAGSQYITSFGFREKILLAALHAFGTQDFKAWCNLQQESPYYTDMHRRFINDTFNFLINGRRAVQIHQWSRLIDLRESNYEDRDTNVAIDDYFSYGDDHGYVGIGHKPFQNIESVIHHWCARTNGIEDLIATLHILFGDNTASQ